ncbi:enoyl-CoA hydratase [Chloroflexota bacterium]
MAFETIICENIDTSIAKITMNRPQYRNAQNDKMTEELKEAFDRAEKDDEVKVIILAGAGPAFSAGHDMGSPEGLEERKKRVVPEGPAGGSAWNMKREENAYLHPCMKWRDIPKPTIAQVQGYCIMGGLMLASAMDIIIAAEDAKFSDQSVRMACAAVEYFPLVWDIGGRMTKEFLFTGDFMDAQTALRCGLVNRVVPNNKLEEETLELARRIARQNPFLLKLAKKMVNDQLDLMGQRQGVMLNFYLHEFAHAHWAQVGPLVKREPGKSVSDFVRARDKQFGNKKK